MKHWLLAAALLLLALPAAVPAWAAGAVKTQAQILSEWQLCASQGLGTKCHTPDMVADVAITAIPEASSVTAVGTNQGTCTALTSRVNNVTSVASGTGVCLPTIAANLVSQRYLVCDNGANALAEYPANGAAIGSLATNAALTIQPGNCQELAALTTTQWGLISPALITGLPLSSLASVPNYSFLANASGASAAPSYLPLAYTTLTPLGGGLDDEPQIAAALAACNTSHGVQLTEGTFTIKEPVSVPRYCHFVGSSKSQIHDGGTGTIWGTVLQQSGSGWSAGQAIVLIHHDQVTIANMVIAGAQSLSPSVDCLQVWSSRGITLDHVSTYQCNNIGKHLLSDGSNGGDTGTITQIIRIEGGTDYRDLNAGIYGNTVNSGQGVSDMWIFDTNESNNCNSTNGTYTRCGNIQAFSVPGLQIFGGRNESCFNNSCVGIDYEGSTQGNISGVQIDQTAGASIYLCNSSNTGIAGNVMSRAYWNGTDGGGPNIEMCGTANESGISLGGNGYEASSNGGGVGCTYKVDAGSVTIAQFEIAETGASFVESTSGNSLYPFCDANTAALLRPFYAAPGQPNSDLGFGGGAYEYGLTARPGITNQPVPRLRPQTANMAIAGDIYPNGSPTPSAWEPYGVATNDICDTDFDVSGASGTCLHLGARQNFQEFGSRTYSNTVSPTAVKDLHLTVGIDNYHTSTNTITDGVIIASGSGQASANAGQVSIPQGFYTPVLPPIYTVATLPASPGTGARATVTDATSCTFLGALTGGGLTKCPVVYTGSAWVGG